MLTSYFTVRVNTCDAEPAVVPLVETVIEYVPAGVPFGFCTTGGGVGVGVLPPPPPPQPSITAPRTMANANAHRSDFGLLVE